ncbi:MAG: hypothetical protein KH019_06890 [Phocaeicola dorei]|nr:hypothetical protein [Phocaeicola dorei]
MFRFDFRDKSMIPTILGTDNRDYLERLTPVLEREKIYPSGVVRLRDAAFCEERGIRQLSASAAHTALAENEDYQRLAHRFGTIGDKELAKLLDGITEKFFEGKGKPKELGFYEIAPLNAKYRSTMGDWQVASPEILNYGICTKRLDMAPTLRNFNRLRNLPLVKVPLTKEQERIMSQLVARPDNTRFSGPNMSVKVPMKRERRGMKI